MQRHKENEMAWSPWGLCFAELTDETTELGKNVNVKDLVC